MKTSTYFHGDDSILKHRLSLEIDPRPQSNETTIIEKSISNHKQHNQAKGNKSNLDYIHCDNT